VLPSRIAHYVVLSRLGTGGMGEVFLAQDDELQRKVAIKRVRPDVLDAQTSRRLLTEARAIARLDHPHVCAIHEIGEDADGPYFVMPFVEGETLSARIARGPLPVEDAVAIASQVVDGLAAAHARGIVHRDVKPGNIMIDARGQVRVMDFGLARVVASPAEASHIETTTRLTIAGSTVGTVAYMSPEQARGGAVDARSDLFSLGVLLYEMLAGRRPFDGASPADTLSALLTREPTPLARVRPEVPDALQRIVEKALRKRADERYQTAGDLLVDLRDVGRAPFDAPAPMAPAASVLRTASSRWVWIAAVVVVVAAVVSGAWRFLGGRTPAAAVPVITSIAVLPLDNLSADPSQDYFADGMTEALTTALARIKSLRVLSRTSTLRYRDAKPSMPEIASALNADALVEGSVLRDGDRVRITAQLIHGPTDRHLWADSYDGDLHDVLGLQRRVAEAIAREVRATVVPDDAAAARPKRPINVRAQDLYLRGRYQFYMFTSMSRRDTDLSDAIASYEHALEIDPTFAEAWAALAQARHWMAGRDTNWASWFDASREAALRALAIDDGVAHAHGALAYVSHAYDWDFATAEREYARALALDPSTEYQHGYAMMLSVLGRHEEARRMFEEAKARDPLNLFLRFNSALARLRSREYAEAIAEARAVEANAPDAPDAYYLIAWAQLWQGHGADALARLEQLAAAGTVERSFDYVALLACAGRTAEARTRLGQLQAAASPRGGPGVAPVSAMLAVAETYTCAGDRDRALATLEQAAAVRLPWLPHVATDRALEPLHTDPRFQALVRRLGL
jgi:eukaryotic-like serine/threonine-protein kinase